jgi:hypothetical protein
MEFSILIIFIKKSNKTSIAGTITGTQKGKAKERPKDKQPARKKTNK